MDLIDLLAEHGLIAQGDLINTDLEGFACGSHRSGGDLVTSEHSAEGHTSGELAVGASQTLIGLHGHTASTGETDQRTRNGRPLRVVHLNHQRLVQRGSYTGRLF